LFTINQQSPIQHRAYPSGYSSIRLPLIANMTQATKLRSKYPLAFKKCIPEALLYGRCLTSSAELRAGECDKEFKVLNDCFRKFIRNH